MGYEVKYIYHPKKEGGGYDTEVKEEKVAKVGKPFDDTGLDKCAAAILAQLARRDIWVVDVEVCELVKKEISFKESSDGKGIVLKNKRFSLGATAQMVEEVDVAPPANVNVVPPANVNLAPVVRQPHENLAPGTKDDSDSLYANPNASSVKTSVDPRNIDKNKRLYHVYFDPPPHTVSTNLKLSKETRYPVHAIIPSPTGKIDHQKIAITDDTGQIVILDEALFTTAGRGLLGDEQLDFSGKKDGKKSNTRLSYEGQMNHDVPSLRNIPVDTGEIPDDLLNMPDLR